ncbi:hypothetical protein GGG87_02895 [Streptococcus sp. zg-86]|uniref:Fungal lipase-like domain-containing protein n=1 Tax=Streptococcus zhangguiae TaxID=2664091 RepID=A0ABW9R1K5_9STRE|nr:MULTISPECIES: hypothetical protein [unclassified Streptococcus]MTB63948.1 hypothetical protein [Streptococcus sp. zg-86]MTB90258.1 hypothetical protein [Streptococcus sp. zg-36]QTH46977.1 hypothetical protein J5M87_05255 [Streptococcus sp. zg-86]
MILMKGSTEPLGGADWVTDWFLNDLPMGGRILSSNNTDDPRADYIERGTGQLKEAANYLNKMMELYPNARVNLYGHSLGSMDVQYAVVSTDCSEVYITTILEYFHKKYCITV